MICETFSFLSIIELNYCVYSTGHVVIMFERNFLFMTPDPLCLHLYAKDRSTREHDENKQPTIHVTQATTHHCYEYPFWQCSASS
jgi:hypothetical protein